MNTIYSAVYHDGWPFTDLLDNPESKVVSVTHPADMLDFNSALVIWGGGDISPEFYKHPISRRCMPYAGRRDRVEWDLLQEAINMEIPIIGVCRGAQMLCAAAGGFLLQDVSNHGGDHKVNTFDGKTFTTNSLHHQMMVPFGVEHEMVAWSAVTKGAPYIYKDDKVFVPALHGWEDIWVEPEFVYFPKINGYAIQWHPEMMYDGEEATEYCLDYIRTKEAARKQRGWAIPEEKKNAESDSSLA